MESVLISTGTSSLTVGQLDVEYKSILDEIIQNIDDFLVVNPRVIVYGKECYQRRSVGFFSDVSIGYQYSGQLMSSLPMTENMNNLLAHINAKYGASFNGILINKYRNGEDTIGAHSDDETGLSREIGVMAISYGAPRIFRIRAKPGTNIEDVKIEKSVKGKTSKIIADIITEPYQVLQMKGDFQREFTHEIPVQKKIKEARYSLTFRTHLK